MKVLIFVISAFFALLNTRTIVPNRDQAKFCNVIYTMNMVVHRNLLLQSRTNMLGFMTHEHSKAKQNGGRSRLKSRLKHSNKSNQSYKTFVMANMQHKPCILSHQHCFLFSLLAFLKTLLKHPKHPSKGRFE